MSDVVALTTIDPISARFYNAAKIFKAAEAALETADSTVDSDAVYEAYMTASDAFYEALDAVEDAQRDEFEAEVIRNETDDERSVRFAYIAAAEGARISVADAEARVEAADEAAYACFAVSSDADFAAAIIAADDARKDAFLVRATADHFDYMSRPQRDHYREYEIPA